MESNNNSFKLHLGCGINIKEGYFNIDQHVSAPSIIKMDIFNLSIDDDVVDEIFTEHMLEHLSKYEVPLALKEWARVLKPDAKLIMNLPNLEWCLQQWLAKPEEERWGWQLDTIFGLQTHTGEFHKTGFTEMRLRRLLAGAGFRQIKINEYWSHGQSCFWVEASKTILSNEQNVVVKIQFCKDEQSVTTIDSNQSHTNENYTLKNIIHERHSKKNQLFEEEYKQTKHIRLASIVIPWWDHTELLDIWKPNLEHLKDAEIIFVDNGSQPQGKLALQEFCHQHNIKLIRNEENRGFAAGNNQGAEVATGEYILFLNNDVQVLNFPLESLCNLAINGIAGPGLMQNELGESYIEGWALCIKNSTLKALGGWCEDYGPGYWDDVDLCYRAKLAGYSLIPIPQIENLMRHKQNTTGRDGRLDQRALHIRNRGIFARKHYSTHPKIIVDGVFFQLYKTGIARVWKSLIEEWVNNGFAKHIVVLDRAGTAPKIPGVRYRLIPAYDYKNTDADREILQQVCDEEAADLFISSYYTTPTTTSSVFMAYDMIPEVMGWDMNNPMWQVKHQAIQNASTYLAISENTARDLVRFFPEIPLESVKVALCGVTGNFSPASQEELNSFKIKYGISKPYFMIVSIGGYKNTILFLEAFAKLYSKQAFDIVCTGGGLLDEQLRAYTSGSTVHMLQLSDEELKIAYSGAVALVYPSKYEGFGLPVLEAIACGCPVITCPNASIPEVAGKAALYVQDNDIEEMANALCEVQKPSVRNSLIAAGLEQAKKFSWSNMAKVVSSTLINTTLLSLNLREINLIVFPDWSQPEESLGLELEKLISAIATHPDSQKITLLIDTSGISSEDAELLLSGVTMNLLMEEGLDITEGLEISLISNLADIQWEALLSRIQARIVLECENKQAIAQVKADNLPSYNLDYFNSLTTSAL
ncbi:MAG: glycosyltransferase [Spirirestis rafaelensis WJT71-NPBG6]|jgi:GT2 family glycosyltransferase/predicted SAM-dependent methyltransferase|nr:glycosyltransferase [Spirirestis rafaelensis WJT71-NPBG6]